VRRCFQHSRRPPPPGASAGNPHKVYCLLAAASLLLCIRSSPTGIAASAMSSITLPTAWVMPYSSNAFPKITCAQQSSRQGRTAVSRCAESPSSNDRGLVSDLEVGQHVEGPVKKVTPMGVFLDIGIKKKKGLIEVSEWLEEGGFPVDYFDSARKLIGKTISARVLRKKGTNVFLTRKLGELRRPRILRGKNMEEDVQTFATMPPDRWFTGQVISMAPWGIYASIREKPGERVEGLIHRTNFVEGFAESASLGQQVRVRVVSANMSTCSLALSMRTPSLS